MHLWKSKDGVMEMNIEKCGITVSPPTFVVVYRTPDKLRRKALPLRNFDADSNVDEVAENLKEKPGLENVPVIKIKKMLRLLQEIIRGADLFNAVEKIQKEYEIKLNEDLNKLSTEELDHQKELMESLFLKNQIKKEDADFVYDKRLDFPEPKAESTWDLDVEDNFWS